MIAIIGGTGNLGRGLAGRLALAGHEIVIGSRSKEKAKRVAPELSNQIEKKVKGTDNLEATEKSEIVFLSIPHSEIDKIMRQIKPGLEPGDILVSVIVPVPGRKHNFPGEKSNSNSSAEKVDLEAPKGVSTISTLQVIPAKLLRNFEEPVNSDVPICGNDSKAKDEIIKLIQDFPGARPIDSGTLESSRLIESTAVLLVKLTKIYGSEARLLFKGI